MRRLPHSVGKHLKHVNSSDLRFGPDAEVKIGNGQGADSILIQKKRIKGLPID
jgi:hypothetical protein